MTMILLILIFIRPFICSLAFPYLNLVFSSVFLGFLIIWLIYRMIKSRAYSRRNLPKNLKFPLILFLSALAISVIFSIDKLNSLQELYKYISGVLIFAAAVCLSYEERIQVLKTITLAGFIIALLAIYQYLFGFRHILEYLTKAEISSDFSLDYIRSRRIFFPFVTPNILGGYLAMIALLFPAALSNGKEKTFIPLFALIVPVSFAIILTKSLGAFLSIFLGLIVYLYLRRALDRKRLLYLCAFLIIIGFVFFIRQGAAKQHLLPTFSMLMRINYWTATLELIRSTPWCGVGLGNFNLAFSRYAHNSYLQIWAETGILGIISFLWLIAAVFQCAFRNINTSAHKKALAGLIAANATFLFHNFIDFSFFLPEVAIIWWALFGLLIDFP